MRRDLFPPHIEMIKLWVDDNREPPIGYVWLKSVYEAKRYIEACMNKQNKLNRKGKRGVVNGNTILDRGHYELLKAVQIEVIDIDHDAGQYAVDGGDYIKLLDWMEEQRINIPVHIHSMNPVGVENMRRIINRNGWEEVP